MATVMETTPPALSPAAPTAIWPPGLYRMTIEKYHELAEGGVFQPDDEIELLDGCLVKKMTKNPAHVLITKRVAKILRRMALAGISIVTQDPFTFGSSEPEPDVMALRGEDDDYQSRHPQATDVLLVVEVAVSSLGFDRSVKKKVYAQAEIDPYWIVNVEEKVVEVYTEPVAAALEYRVVTRYRPGDQLPVVLAGTTLGTFDPAELFA